MWGRLVITTNPVQLSCGFQGSSNHWIVLEGWFLCSPCGTLPKPNDWFSFVPQCECGTLKKHLYTCTLTIECTYWQNKGHTGVELVSRSGCLPSVIPSPRFPQTISVYTLDLECLSMWYLCVGWNEQYGHKLRWSATLSRCRLGLIISENAGVAL